MSYADIWYTASDQRAAVRYLGFGLYALPVVVVTGLSVRQGEMIDPPRPRLLRPAGALQWLLAARALLAPTAGTRERGR